MFCNTLISKYLKTIFLKQVLKKAFENGAGINLYF